MAESAEKQPVTQPDSTGELTLTGLTLATFDVTALVLAALVALHASGALADLLSGLNTVVGVAVFGYLWILVVLAVRWVLSAAPLGAAGLGTLALRGVAAGAVTGIAFLLGAFLVAVVPQLLTGPIEAVSLVLIVTIGAAVAAVVGALVGLVAALLNVAVYRAAGALLSEGGDDTAPTVTPDRP